MPLDPMYVDPMLGTFRTMMAEVEAKNLAGPDVDRMRQVLGHMEQLAREMDDFAAYSGRLTQDNAFQQFSDAYGKALASAARSGGTSDQDLLAQTVSGYQQALDSYRAGHGGDKVRMLIPYLERIVEVGGSGVSYPVFLRIMEEEGLTRALDGAAPATRAALEQSLQFAREAWQPYRVEQAEKVLAAYDQMIARAPFGQPDPLELELTRQRIEWEYEPMHRRWSAVVDRWSHILTELVDWLDAHASFAPRDTRWRPPGCNDEAAVQRNIARTRECTPGDLRYREGILAEYFRLSFDDIFTHDSFRFEYTARRVTWSDERLRLIRETRPHCRPGGAPPAELIARAEALHPRGDVRPDPGKAPPWGTPLASPF